MARKPPRVAVINEKLAALGWDSLTLDELKHLRKFNRSLHTQSLRLIASLKVQDESVEPGSSYGLFIASAREQAERVVEVTNRVLEHIDLHIARREEIPS